MNFVDMMKLEDKLFENKIIDIDGAYENNLNKYVMITLDGDIKILQKSIL